MPTLWHRQAPPNVDADALAPAGPGGHLLGEREGLRDAPGDQAGPAAL
jgi:hypothetical protein